MAVIHTQCATPFLPRSEIFILNNNTNTHARVHFTLFFKCSHKHTHTRNAYLSINLKNAQDLFAIDLYSVRNSVFIRIRTGTHKENLLLNGIDEQSIDFDGLPGCCSLFTVDEFE